MGQGTFTSFRKAIGKCNHVQLQASEMQRETALSMHLHQLQSWKMTTIDTHRSQPESGKEL